MQVYNEVMKCLWLKLAFIGSKENFKSSNSKLGQREDSYRSRILASVDIKLTNLTLQHTHAWKTL